MASDRPDEIERLIGNALSSYSASDPRPGLEERVLERVRTVGAARRFVFPRWAWLAAAAACVLLVVMLAGREGRPDHEVAVMPRPTVRPAPPPAPSLARTTKPAIRRTPRLPKQPQFPAPAPLTAQERALLDLVTRAPEKAQEIMMTAGFQKPEPIRIEPLDIPPLQSDGPQ